MRVRATAQQIDALDRALARAQARGALQWFNAAYAEHREANAPGMSYLDARAKLRTALLRQLLEGKPWNIASLKAEIFQPISRNTRHW